MVKDGFKQTDIGFIPVDWNIGTLSSIVLDNNGLVRGPFGGALKKEFFVSKGYKVYEQRNAIYKSVDIGSYFINAEKYNELKRFEVQEKDFIVSCSGTIGKIYQIPLNSPKGVINQALLKIKLDSKKVSDYYFLSVFSSKEFQNKITDNSHGGAMPNLVGMDVFRNTLLKLPPIEEQKAIAKALSDTDELITSLEKLISKKEAIKQGTMQQLLTGKKRLSAFSGEWEEKKLGDIGIFSKGSGVKKEESLSGHLPCVRYGEIYTLHNEVIKEFKSYISHNVALTAKKIKQGDILFAGSGETKEEIGKSVSYIFGYEAYAGGDIVILSPKNINSSFLGYLLNIPQIQNQKASKGQGDAVVHISANSLSEVVIKIPSDIEEQQTIAQILSDMDNEIESLKSKLSKTKAIKDGMMSELLTGKTRLI